MKKGIESLTAAVKKDCESYENCFSTEGCTKVRTRMESETNPRLIEMGWTTCCRQVVKCSHDYCGKYKWIMDRAKHYAEVCGSTVESVIEEWEKARTYWYMNYYQECNQPLIKGENIIMYDAWIAELTKRFGEDSKQWKFKCPACGHV
jgi:hypothetical protein